ncbi:HNH endonuclease signature motif containing protein [Nocardioides mesophilus]|nr:HNH endonuclease signature motif containing protein [Nocardioides mesophilus]
MGFSDKTCTVEGCDRPASWSQAHHKIPWADGGRTSVEDGRLACSFHHHRIHDKAYRAIYLDNGKIRLIRQ